MRISKIIFLALLTAFLSGCLEATFQLSDKSRLPKWFVVPKGMDRRDFTVRMDSHSTIGGGGGKNVFKLYEKNKFFHIKKYTVTLKEQPSIRTVHLKSQPEGTPKGYPRYKVVTLNNITDVIEFRKMEPIFYTTDDPAILKELGAIQ